MALKELAVQGATIAHDSGSPISGGTFSITSVPSLKVKAEGNGVYKTPLLYTFAGGNAAGFVPGSVLTTAPQSISATAQKCKAENLPVMRIDDSGVMNAIGTLPPPAGGTAPIAGPVIIDDAGQVKAKGE